MTYVMQDGTLMRCKAVGACDRMAAQSLDAVTADGESDHNAAV